MKSTWKTIASMLFNILGALGWCYVGGWMILKGPVKAVMIAHEMGCLSIGKLLVAMLQGFVYLSLAGGVWCIGYILSNHFKDCK